METIIQFVISSKENNPEYWEEGSMTQTTMAIKDNQLYSYIHLYNQNLFNKYRIYGVFKVLFYV